MEPYVTREALIAQKAREKGISIQELNAYVLFPSLSLSAPLSTPPLSMPPLMPPAVLSCPRACSVSSLTQDEQSFP